MNENIASICRTQNLKYDERVIAFCPLCEVRALELVPGEDEAECKNCRVIRKVEDWNVLIQDEFEYERRKIIELMTK